MSSDSVRQDNKQMRYTSNFDELNTPDIIELRLSTERDIARFESFLRGEELIRIADPEDASKTIIQAIDRGEALANNHGVNQIISLFSKIANPNVVQANFSERRDYDSYIFEVDTGFLADLIIKAPEWDIKTNNIGVIHDMFIFYVIPYMSRAFQNKEREHLSGGMRPAEFVSGDSRQGQEGGGSWWKKKN